MNKEELKQEAEEYLRKQTQLNGGGLFHCNILNLILGFAEPREKRIAELEKELAISEHDREHNDYELTEVYKKVAELEAQIEKMKVKWHDLEKDPNDLPKDCKTMCICLSDFGSKYEPVPRVCVGYCDSLGWSDYMGSSLYSTVRYWCELPK